MCRSWKRRDICGLSGLAAPRLSIPFIMQFRPENVVSCVPLLSAFLSICFLPLLHYAEWPGTGEEARMRPSAGTARRVEPAGT